MKTCMYAGCISCEILGLLGGKAAYLDASAGCLTV